MKRPPKGSIIIRPSYAIAAEYRRDLLQMVRDMAGEIHTEVMGIYRPYIEMQRAEMAGDASIVSLLMNAFRRLRDRWLGVPKAQKTAERFVASIDTHVSGSLVRGLRDTYGVEKAPEAEKPPEKRPEKPKRLKGADLETTMEAAVAENVGLIKSIPAQYLDQVQREVLQAVQEGWPLDRLSQALQHRYGVTKRRADLIAKDQCAKITEEVKEKRALAAGFTEATWWHSEGGRYPRKSHQRANGKRYELAKGCWIDNEYIRPAQKINCRCFCTFHLPGQ